MHANGTAFHLRHDPVDTTGQDGMAETMGGLYTIVPDVEAMVDNGIRTTSSDLATLLFDPSMSALPIIVKQNSPSVGLFTHQ